MTWPKAGGVTHVRELRDVALVHAWDRVRKTQGPRRRWGTIRARGCVARPPSTLRIHVGRSGGALRGWWVRYV